MKLHFCFPYIIVIRIFYHLLILGTLHVMSFFCLKMSHLLEIRVHKTKALQINNLLTYNALIYSFIIRLFFCLFFGCLLFKRFFLVIYFSIFNYIIRILLRNFDVIFLFIRRNVVINSVSSIPIF